MQSTEEKRNKPLKLIAISALVIVFCAFSIFADWEYIYSLCGLRADTQNKMSVSFISVGDADAAYIHLDDTDIMIDCGTESSAEKTVNYLKRYGCKKLDAVILSHPDSDHIGGAAKIIGEFCADKIYCYDTPTQLVDDKGVFKNLNDFAEENNLQREYIKCGDEFAYGELQFKVISPCRSYDNTNDCSLVIKLCYKEKSFLFTGDISGEVEAELAQNGCDISADVLKASHHGSAYSSTAEFLEAVSPEITVISADTDDLYLPDYSVEYRISKISSEYITGRDGCVVVTTDGKSLEVQTNG